ncbi:hypothetical protein COO60DRAFT_1699010 [Scenedesmus sp. NREL 46B-D3]|nr:hypothetical protein COO60DRAFT_1699010 [Scenedesmus sp. NREL 46B-D3]
MEAAGDAAEGMEVDPAAAAAAAGKYNSHALRRLALKTSNTANSSTSAAFTSFGWRRAVAATSAAAGPVTATLQPIWASSIKMTKSQAYNLGSLAPSAGAGDVAAKVPQGTPATLTGTVATQTATITSRDAQLPAATATAGTQTDMAETAALPAAELSSGTAEAAASASSSSQVHMPQVTPEVMSMFQRMLYMAQHPVLSQYIQLLWIMMEQQQHWSPPAAAAGASAAVGNIPVTRAAAAAGPAAGPAAAEAAGKGAQLQSSHSSAADLAAAGDQQEQEQLKLAASVLMDLAEGPGGAAETGGINSSLLQCSCRSSNCLMCALIAERSRSAALEANVAELEAELHELEKELDQALDGCDLADE